MLFKRFKNQEKHQMKFEYFLSMPGFCLQQIKCHEMQIYETPMILPNANTFENTYGCSIRKI